MKTQSNRYSAPQADVCKKCLTNIVHVGLYLGVFVGFSSAAFAEGEHASHHALKDTIPYWINFVLYIFLLRYLLKDKIRVGWANRRNRIATEVQAAQLEKQKAESLLADNRKLLASVDSQIAAAKDQIKRQAELEAKEIIESAKQKAKRINVAAHDGVEAGKRAALRAVKQEVIEEALKKARAAIGAEVKSGADTRYREAALKSSSRLVN